MSSFFTNLVDRHLGTCDTIKPRSLGRFEMDNSAAASSVDNAASGLTEHDQTHSELHVDDSPSMTAHKPNSTENKNDFSSPSYSDQKTPPSNETEVHTTRPDSHVLPIKPQITQPLSIDMQSKRGMVQPDRRDKTHQEGNEKNIFNNALIPNTKSHKVIPDDNPPSISSAGQYVLENELNARINAMLHRLAGDTSTPLAQPDQGNRSHQNDNATLLSTSSETKNSLLDSESSMTAPTTVSHRESVNETLAPISPETEISSLNAINTSPELTPVSSRRGANEENHFSENKDIGMRHNQLEPPLWLSDMASQLTQRLQEKETKNEPVINVTIGRVEVRAVQTEKPKSVRQTKKPTGVMTLNDYLKRREGGGAK